MKTLFAVCVVLLFCTVTISHASKQATTVYNETVFTEDVTWRGSILVKGFVVVAPHATLRIEPGTVVRFAAAAAQQLPNLVVQGRIHAAGISDRPILMTSERLNPPSGAWGGLVLLSTEKRNLLEHCNIEYAETGIDMRFSKLTLKSVTITQAKTALLSHDGVLQLTDCNVSDSEIGLDVHNSEFDGKDTTISSCRFGSVFSKSGVVLASLKILNNQQTGFAADDCRIKITDGEFNGNALGARINDSEGQIIMSRFQKNRQIALHLSGSRIKIQRCLLAENSQDALRTEDGLALILNNAFTNNGGYNLYNAGLEAVGARQNWWGGVDQSRADQKIYDHAVDNHVGTVDIYPWLNDRPLLVP